MGETEIPEGEVYSCVERANGELGFTSSATEEEHPTGCISAAHTSLLPGIRRAGERRHAQRRRDHDEQSEPDRR